MKSKRKKSFPVAVAAGTVASLACTVVGCGVLALAVQEENVNQGGIGYGVMAVTFLSAIMGSIVSRILWNQKTLLLCAASSLAYYLIMLGVGALIFDGSMEGLLVTLLLVLGAGTAVAFVGINGNQRRKKRPYPFRNG